mmetsp:Transcript_6306/g.7778  ORF Transcript_6306/g.7778 Transcript_6306/m.7778 type:complete len:86 (+) Transcript_6306:179-436(+)
MVDLLLARDDVDVNIKDHRGRTGFHYAYEKLYNTSPIKLVKIGGLLCAQRNIHPSELMKHASSRVNPQIIDLIQTSITKQKSARK